MTNAEKYKDAIMAQMRKTGDWALNKSGEITPCACEKCADCEFNINSALCDETKKEWLNAEVKKAFSEKDKKDRLTYWYWEWLDDEVDMSRVPCCDLFDLDNIPEEERDGVEKLLRRCAELEDDDGTVEVEVEVLQGDVENLTRTLEKSAAEFQEVQHRAEVAECALQKFAEYITCEDCPFFSDCASSEKMGHPIHSNRCFSEYLKQAEKELQEESK